MQRRLLSCILMFLVCLSALAYLAREMAWTYALRHEAEISRERLRLVSATLSMRIERFRYLPEVVARSREIERLLTSIASPDIALEANQLLTRINRASDALALYVTDLNGLTLAASNYDQSGSFVGQNYAYRPYFQNALRTGFGSYYAVGATTGAPGYFLATPIRAADKTVGVSIVKIDLLPLEQKWREASETVAMSDEEGIIFLSSNPDLRYTAINPIRASAMQGLKAERRYGDAPLVPSPFQVEPVGGFQIANVGRNGALSESLMSSMSFGNDGWTLNYFADLSAVNRQANMVALAAALSILLLGAAGLIAFQQIRARRVARRAVIELEARVDDRTSELRSSNDRLEREIGERQEAERQLNNTRSNLSQAEKLAAIGQTFAGLAHEINQPLAALQTYISSTKLLVKRSELDVAGSNLDMMSDVVQRVSDLTNQLKRLARRNDGDFAELDLSRTVRRTLGLLKFRLNDLGISVDENLPDGLRIIGSETQLDQVVLNLLSNAIDAVRDREQRSIAVRAYADDDSCVLTVDDNGPGIAPEARDHMFEPFHTTKAPGEGLGLGLATANRIVADHHGRLSFESSPLGGARFIIHLASTERSDAARLQA